MDQVQSKRIKKISLLFILLVAIVVLPQVWMNIKSKPTGSVLFTDVPTVKLDLQNKDGQPAEIQFNTPCVHCTDTAGVVSNIQLKYNRQPIALSVYFEKGQNLVSWFQDSAQGKDFEGKLHSLGVFSELERMLKIRAEDVKLSGVKGEFAKALLKEALNANASLHYDITRGAQGFTFTYDSEKAPTNKLALSAAIATLARRQFVHEKLERPIFEVQLGKKTLYATESQKRIFISYGLPTLLNALSENITDQPKKYDSDVTLRVRAEAFFDKLLPLIAGKPTWYSDYSLSVTNDSLTPGVVHVENAPLFTHLSPAITQGVLAAIPPDSFLGLATSFSLPPEFTQEDWNLVALRKPLQKTFTTPSEGGIGFVWDFNDSGDSGVSAVGIILARSKQEATLPIEDYFSEDLSQADCGGDTIWLGSNSEKLLARMKDACDRQSKSLLDIPVAENAQVVMALNAGASLPSLVKKGITLTSEEREQSTQEPAWKENFKKAVGRAEVQANTVLGQIPGIVFAGRLEKQELLMPGTFFQVQR